MKTSTKIFVLFCLIIGLFSFLAPKEPETKAELGELLFHEKKLSRDESISCSSCHNPKFAFADTVAFSLGVGKLKGNRNTPSVTNMSARSAFFYDGRAATLEEQVHFPVQNSVEMDFTIQAGVNRLLQDDLYKRYFQKIYGHLPDSASVVDAIAAFEKTLETGSTPFDEWMSGKTAEMSESAMRGREVFMSKKAKCFDCHFSPDFTGDEFRNIGLYDGQLLTDKGRFDFTKDSTDIGKFKVPGLRNVAKTAPYMHNGMFKTLREVIDYYDNPFKIVKHPLNTDSLIKDPLHLSEQEKTDLEEFLKALTDRRFN